MADSSLVSICIPHLGREEALQRCLAAIAENTTDWPYEIVVERDEFGPGRQGCPRTLAKAVSRANGEFIAFLGNDTLPQPVWLKAAMGCMNEVFPHGTGMVGLHDPYWGPCRCLHWVASKSMLPLLGGYYFWPEYSHVGVDDELIARSTQLGRYVWCAGAVVAHEHFATGAEMDDVYKLAWDPASVERDRALLRERSERMGFAPWLPK